MSCARDFPRARLRELGFGSDWKKVLVFRRLGVRTLPTPLIYESLLSHPREVWLGRVFWWKQQAQLIFSLLCWSAPRNGNLLVQICEPPAAFDTPDREQARHGGWWAWPLGPATTTLLMTVKAKPNVKMRQHASDVYRAQVCAEQCKTIAPEATSCASCSIQSGYIRYWIISFASSPSMLAWCIVISTCTGRTGSLSSHCFSSAMTCCSKPACPSAACSAGHGSGGRDCIPPVSFSSFAAQAWAE